MSNDEGYARLALAMLIDSLRLARQGDQLEREWLMVEGRYLLHLLGVDVTQRDMQRAIETKPKRRRIWLH